MEGAKKGKTHVFLKAYQIRLPMVERFALVNKTSQDKNYLLSFPSLYEDMPILSILGYLVWEGPCSDQRRSQSSGDGVEASHGRVPWSSGPFNLSQK